MSYMPGLVECRSDQELTGLGDKMHDETLKQGKKVKKQEGWGKVSFGSALGMIFFYCRVILGWSYWYPYST